MKFPLTFTWIQGTAKPVADTLSRFPPKEPTEAPATPQTPTKASLAKGQGDLPTLGPTTTARSATVVSALLVGIFRRFCMAADQDPAYERLRAMAQDPATNYDLWRTLIVDEAGRIIVPADDKLRTLLLAENYDAPLAGHFGVAKTQALIERY